MVAVLWLCKSIYSQNTSLTNSWLISISFPGLHSQIQTTFRNGFLSKIPHGKLHEGLHISIQIINFMIHFISLHPSIL